MPEPSNDPRSIEALAFATLLQRMAGLEKRMESQEHAMKSIPPLLKKIIDHLEAQTKQPEVPVATYAHLYPELQDAAYTDDDAALLEAAKDVTPPPKKQPWWLWFMREASS